MKIQNTDKKFDALVFDFDNTLFDYEGTEREALRSVFKDMNIPFFSEYSSMFISINRRLWRDTENDKSFAKKNLRIRRFTELFKKIGYDDSLETAQEASRLFLLHSEKGCLIDGVKETLNELKSMGYILGVASAGLSVPRRKKLENSEIANCFDFTMYREDFDNNKVKPHRDFYDRISIKLSDILRERILYVGDSFEPDVKGSATAGFSAVWFNYFNADEASVDTEYCYGIIKHFSELINLIN